LRHKARSYFSTARAASQKTPEIEIYATNQKDGK